MRERNNISKLRELCFGAETFSSEILTWIEKENLWNLWVPKSYGGLEMTFSEGLDTLKYLAKIDGSLGWTVTLCSGANYFVGNLSPEIAERIFGNSQRPVLGGSGGVFGTAQKKGGNFILSGKWHYATGAPYLTHFTLNAKILDNGKEVTDSNGSPKILSFVVPKKDVEIFRDWNTMGLKATATYSFTVKDLYVPEKFCFLYDQFFLPQPIFKINFSAFADLTLWVNYLGMTEHFYEEASEYLESEKLTILREAVSAANKDISVFATEIEEIILNKSRLSDTYIKKVHEKATGSVQQLSNAILYTYPALGIRACSTNQQLNQIFRDYFTATQHHIFLGDK